MTKKLDMHRTLNSQPTPLREGSGEIHRPKQIQRECQRIAGIQDAELQRGVRAVPRRWSSDVWRPAARCWPRREGREETSDVLRKLRQRALDDDEPRHVGCAAHERSAPFGLIDSVAQFERETGMEGKRCFGANGEKKNVALLHFYRGFSGTSTNFLQSSDLLSCSSMSNDNSTCYCWNFIRFFY